MDFWPYLSVMKKIAVYPKHCRVIFLENNITLAHFHWVPLKIKEKVTKTMTFSGKLIIIFVAPGFSRLVLECVFELIASLFAVRWLAVSHNGSDRSDDLRKYILFYFCLRNTCWKQYNLWWIIFRVLLLSLYCTFSHSATLWFSWIHVLDCSQRITKPI